MQIRRCRCRLDVGRALQLWCPPAGTANWPLTAGKPVGPNPLDEPSALYGGCGYEPAQPAGSRRPPGRRSIAQLTANRYRREQWRLPGGHSTHSTPDRRQRTIGEDGATNHDCCRRRVHPWCASVSGKSSGSRETIARSGYWRLYWCLSTSKANVRPGSVSPKRWE